MRRFVGLGVIVLGIVLLVSGLNAQDSVASRFSRFWTGSSTDKTIWLLIGGGLATLVGASMAFYPGRQRTN